MRSAKKRSTALALGAVLALTACGGGGGGTSSGGSGGGGSASSGGNSRGPITYVQGKDNSGVIQPIIDKWNAAHPDEKVTLKEQTDEADQQHDDLVQHFQAKDAGYDVVNVDNIWTSEFAAKGWLTPFKGDSALDESGLLAPTVKAAKYQDVQYAAPTTSDGGLLYYRKDLVPNPPKTWDEMMSSCPIAKQHGMECYAGQFAKYEGLTVNVAEGINTNGGEIVGSNGIKPVLGADATAGLQRLVDAFKSGNIPQQALTYQEEQGRQAFEDGKLLFLRNWPYVYALATTDASSQVKDTIGVAPLPGVVGAKTPGVSSLGGHAAAISVYSDHKKTALDFIKFLQSDEIQRFWLTKASAAPVLSALYNDAALVQQFPYLPQLQTSIENAEPRPVTPFYPAVTKAIQDNSYAALSGGKTADQAIKDMTAAIASATSAG